jgi:hypothetical protein
MVVKEWCASAAPDQMAVSARAVGSGAKHAAVQSGCCALLVHAINRVEVETLSGKIQSISMAAPHPMLQVLMRQARRGRWIWAIPARLNAPASTEDTAKAGDAITVLGNRNRERARLHMKAVRITIAGKSFDLYPERITPK